MQINQIQKNQISNFQGRIHSNMLPKMLKNFTEQELAEYKTLISKAEKVKDGKVFGIVKGRKYDMTKKKVEYFDYYQFVETHPETENTLAPLSYCIKQVLSEKISFIRKGYNEQEFPKACIEIILEPLRKLYGEHQ